MDGLIVLAKALLCGGVVWALIRGVDGAPPPVVAWVIAMPMTLGAGLLAVAGTQDDAFLIRAALGASMAMPAMLAFMMTAARLFDRLSPAPLIAVSLIAWFVVIAVCTPTGPWNLPTALAVGAAALIVSHLVLPYRVAFTARIAGSATRRAWVPALQSALMVLILSMVSGRVGPVFSAWIASAPMAMTFVTLGMKRANSRNAAATYQSARLGVPCLFAYLATVVLLTPRLGGTPATILAFLPSLGLSALIVAGRLTLTPKETA